MPKESEPLDRSSLTFEQAEGVEPLPQQLAPKHVSPELRAVLWSVIWASLNNCKIDRRYGPDEIGGQWKDVLRTLHVFRDHKMIDDFSDAFDKQAAGIKRLISHGTYVDIFGWLQAVLRHPRKPENLDTNIDRVLVYSRAAYRVINQTTIAPISSDEEREAIEGALRVLHLSPFQGASTHLRQAASELGLGQYADSVRNSVHAVEAMARVITGRDKLSDALTELEKSTKMHSAMKRGFTALYGWTSDEGGIRHPLLEEGDANVSEADALFMLGACASFVSFLAAKVRAKEATTA